VGHPGRVGPPPRRPPSAVGVRETSGVHASKVLCLTPGGRQGVPVDGLDAIAWHRGDARRKPSKHLASCRQETAGAGREPSGPPGRSQPRASSGRARVRKAQPDGRRVPWRLDRSRAAGTPLERPCVARRGDASVGASGQDTPVSAAPVRECVGARGQLLAARRRGTRHGGSPGLDGRTGEAWPGDRREPWPQIREARLAGTSRPPPVTRVEIPKPGGGAHTQHANGAGPVHPAGAAAGVGYNLLRRQRGVPTGASGPPGHRASPAVSGGGLQRGGGPGPGDVLRPGQPRQAEEAGEAAGRGSTRLTA
jgi:hypothetical protein